MLYFLIRFSIGFSAPLYSRSGSLIGSAYLFLYISFCFGINKTLTNLTLLRQHHLQYTGGLAVTQGLLLPSSYCDALYATHQTHTDIFSSFQNFYKRLLFFSELSFLSEHFALKSVNFQHNGRSCSNSDGASSATGAKRPTTAATAATAATATAATAATTATATAATATTTTAATVGRSGQPTCE
jgi:hypothetical protein